jgi:hypothetical protein
MIIDSLLSGCPDPPEKREWFHIMLQLHDKQMISSQLLLEELGIDYDKEMEQIRKEQAPLKESVDAGLKDALEAIANYKTKYPDK